MLLVLQFSCLIDHDRYEKRLAELRDADGDGHPSLDAGGDDCDDANAGIHPQATELPYDAIDQDCDGADLVDVDGDGHAGTDAGGDDCDDASDAVWPGAPEGWSDLSTDNDCDGSLADPVASELQEVGAVISPPEAAGWFGNEVGSLPDLDGDGLAEAWASAPYEAGGEAYLGAVYLLNGTLLVPGEDRALASTDAVFRGSAEGDLLGSGVSAGEVGRDGSATLFVSAIGRDGGAGAVYGVPSALLPDLTGSDPASSASVVVRGSPGAYLGTRVAAGHDQDGDGVHDLLVEAPGAGAVYRFASPAEGSYALDDADGVWTTAEGWLNFDPLGDVDGDGLDDIGVVRGDTDAGTVGAALYRGGGTAGEFPEGSHVSFLGAPRFGAFVVTPWDDRVLVMLQWQASAFLQLESGAVYDVLTDADWMVFRDGDEGGFSKALWIDHLGDIGPAFLLMAPFAPVGSDAGEAVVWAEPDWGTVFAHDLQVSLRGQSAGDRAFHGAALVGDRDGDGEEDLLIGADGAGEERRGSAVLLLAP